MWLWAWDLCTPKKKKKKEIKIMTFLDEADKREFPH